MSASTRQDWRPVLKRFIIAFLFALSFAVPVFFMTGRFRDPQGGTVLLWAGALLWCVCVFESLRCFPVLNVLATATGLTWGFLFSLSVAISIENGELPVVWYRMIPALVLIPIAVTATVLPFSFVRRIIKSYQAEVA